MLSQFKSLPPTATPDTLQGTTPHRETGSRQDPFPHEPKLIPSSSQLRSLASYSRLALCQRNPLPIQIPLTYSHSCNPTGDHSSQETGTRQYPCPHAPEVKPRVLGSDHWHYTQGWPTAKGILSQFKFLPPTSTPTTLKRTTPTRETGTRQDPCSHVPELILKVLGSDHWHHTPGWHSAKGILSQFELLPPTTTPATLKGTTPPRRQVPDKTHFHMHLT